MTAPIKHRPADEADPPDMLRLEDILQRARGHSGSAVQDIEAELRRVTTALYQADVLEGQEGVSGSVTITIGLKAERGAVAVTTGVSSKLPGAPKRKALAFADEKGRLLPQDPTQKRLNFGVQST